jgi:hypothetical protein
MTIISKNHQTRMFTWISVVGLMLVMNACAQTRMNAEYYVGFMNKAGHLLDAVSVYYGQTQAAAAGGMVNGGRKTDGPVTLPIPSEAEVRWIDNGEPHTVKVKLEGVVPKGLTDDWTLYFVINQDATVQVKAIKDDDKAAMAELTKGLRPKEEYRLGFVNKTGRDLQAVSVYYGDQQAGVAGDILTRVKVGYSDPLTLPIPLEAEVRWKESGADHAFKAKFEGVVPKGYAAGTIFFVIKPDNTVEVHPVKWGDDKGAAKLVK